MHGRVPRRRALERVADVVVAVLEDAREVGVAGPRQRHRLLCPCPRGSPSGGHGLIPHVQFLWSLLRTTSASGVPSVRPCRSPASTSTWSGLDLLPRRAAVALLPPLEVGVDRVAVEQEPGGQAGDDRDERRPVRFAGGGERQRHADKPKPPPGGRALPSNNCVTWILAAAAPGTLSCADVNTGGKTGSWASAVVPGQVTLGYLGAMRTAARMTSTSGSRPVQRSKQIAPCATSDLEAVDHASQPAARAAATSAVSPPPGR